MPAPRPPRPCDPRDPADIETVHGIPGKNPICPQVPGRTSIGRNLDPHRSFPGSDPWIFRLKGISLSASEKIKDLPPAVPVLFPLNFCVPGSSPAAVWT